MAPGAENQGLAFQASALPCPGETHPQPPRCRPSSPAPSSDTAKLTPSAVFPSAIMPVKMLTERQSQSHRHQQTPGVSWQGGRRKPWSPVLWGWLLGVGSREWGQATFWFLRETCDLFAEAAVGMEFHKDVVYQFPTAGCLPCL